MWGGFEAPNGLHLMAFDVPPGAAVRPRRTTRSSSRSAATTPTRSPGASRCSPRAARSAPRSGPALWGSPLYGMLDDRFGITWVLDVAVG